MITAADTNILLDILIPNTKYLSSSKEMLDEAVQQGTIIISEVVYAELASQFDTEEELEEFLKETGIRLKPSSTKAMQRAGGAWKDYATRRNKDLQCPKCGKRHRIECTGCGELIIPRQHILSDFWVGGHAEEMADVLLTRDRGYYRTYFKGLKLKP